MTNDPGKPLRILALEPYYAGSHRAFIDGWIRNSRHKWTLLTLPGHHWKWRMRHSAISMAHRTNELVANGKSFDLVFATDMLNLAEFKGLVCEQIRELKHVFYFHENQFTYPNRKSEQRDFHFGFTNLISSVAADSVWFNSNFNFEAFTNFIENAMPKWPDHIPKEQVTQLKRRSQTEYPGVDLPLADPPVAKFSLAGSPIHLVWAARWEHDKQPEVLLQALRLLKTSGINFRVSVIGESFQSVPPSFAEIESEFSDELVRFGYQNTRADYFDALTESDIYISTASHEFFGLSAVEAIVCGVHPLLPDRLAYPELLSHGDTDASRYLYDGTVENLVEGIRNLADKRSLLSADLASIFRKKFSWDSRAGEMDSELSRIEID